MSRRARRPQTARIGRAAAALACALGLAIAFSPFGIGPEPVQAQERQGEGQEEPEEGAEPAFQDARIDSPYEWIPRGFRLGGFGGRLSGARGNLDFGPGPAEIGGGRLRVRVSSPLSLEAGLGGGLSDRFVVDPLAEGGPRAVDSVPLRWLAVDGGLQVALTGARTWNRLHPYVTLGAGLLFGVDQPISPLERPTEPPEEEEAGEADGEGAGGETGTEQPDLSDFRYAINTAPTLQAGLGTELLLSDRIGIGLEARNFLFRLVTPSGYFRADVLEALEEADGPAPRESQWTNNLHLTLSLWYYF